jgi:hypothetical protein
MNKDGTTTSERGSREEGEKVQRVEELWVCSFLKKMDFQVSETTHKQKEG